MTAVPPRSQPPGGGVVGSPGTQDAPDSRSEADGPRVVGTDRPVAVVARRVAAGERTDVVAADLGVDRPAVLDACWWQAEEGAPSWREAWGVWAGRWEDALTRGRYDEVVDPPPFLVDG